MWLLYHIVHRGNMHFGGNKANVKIKDITPWQKVALELLHHRLGHRSTRSLVAVNNANVWQDIELRIDPDPFFHIMSDIFNE